MKKTYFFILFSLVCFFTSCRNFLGGSNLRPDIEDQIRFLNSSPISISIQGDNKAVNILSNKVIELKENQTSKIEFTLDSGNYEFLGWNVYKKGDSSKKSYSSKVSLSTTNQENTYTTTLKLLQADTDLLLEANCYRLPAVEKFEPEYYDSGVSCFQEIHIYFTQPMQNEHNELSDFTNIKIYNSYGDNLNGYFHNPELIYNNTILVIRPNIEKISELLENNSVYDISVILSDTLHEKNSYYRTLKKNDKYTYRINSSQDIYSPIFLENENAETTFDRYGLCLEKEVLNFENGQKEKKEINNKDLNDWEESDYYNHHLNDSIFISAKGTDIGSGIKALLIKETLLHYSDGVEATIPSAENEIGVFSFNKGNFYECSFEYELFNKEGLIKLEIKLVDYFGNTSEAQNYFVINNTKKSPEIILENLPYSENNSDNNSDNNKFWVPSKQIILDDYFYKDKEKVYLKNNKISLYYWDEGSEPVFFETITNYIIDNNTKKYRPKETKFEVNPKNKSYFKVIVENEFGIKTEKTFEIPESIINYSVYSFYNTSSYFHNPRYVCCIGGYNLHNFYKNAKTVVYSAKDFLNLQNSLSQTIQERTNFTPNPNTYYKVSLIQHDDSNFFYSDSLYFLTFYIDGNYNVKSIDDTVNNNPKTWPTFTYTCENAGENTGLYNVNVNYTNTGDEDHNYKLYCKYIDNEGGIEESCFNQPIYLYPDSNSFTLKCGRNYEIGIAIYDKYNLAVEYKKYGDLTATSKDNKPLKENDFYIIGAAISPNSFRLKADTTPNKALTIKYYVEKNTNPSLLDFPYKENTNPDIQEYTINFTTDSDSNLNTYVTCPFEAEDSLYNVYAKILDKNGNYCCKTKVISARQNPDGGKFCYSEYSTRTVNSPSEGTFYILDIPKEQDNSNSGSFTRLNSQNKWEEVPHIGGNYITAYIGENKIQYSAVGPAYSSTTGFVKINTRCQNIPVPSDYTGSVYVYENDQDADYREVFYGYSAIFVPQFFFNKQTMSRKNVVTGLLGVNIYTDKQTLVQTLYSKYNWGDDADLWTARGYENDIKIVSQDTIYNPVTTGIPKGYYYCAVVHFADGTSCMGNVNIMK